jgi:hypothetical protein
MRTKVIFDMLTKADANALQRWWNGQPLRDVDFGLKSYLHIVAQSTQHPRFFALHRIVEGDSFNEHPIKWS